jgi:hypothetical protein
VQTDRPIPNNKPNIITRDNKKTNLSVIYAAIPGDRNVVKKEAGNILNTNTLQQKRSACGMYKQN